MNKIKRAIPTILLFAVYIYLYETYEITWNAKGKSNMGYVPVLIGIAATIVYYFVSSKLLKIKYDRVGNFIPQAVVFIVANYFAMLYYEYTLKVEDWFTLPLLMGITFLFMYLMGSSIYAFGVGIVKSIKEKRFWGTLKRIVSVIVGYLLYFGFILARQWVDEKWDSIYGAQMAFLTITKFAALFVLTAIFHFINRKLFKISSEKFRDHAVLLWFFICISLVRCFFHVWEDDIILVFLVEVISIVFTYVGANLTYYLVKNLWNAFLKGKNPFKSLRNAILKRKEKVKAEKNLRKDEILMEDEITSSGISSDIILIPGIDDDWGEAENDGNKDDI